MTSTSQTALQQEAAAAEGAAGWLSLWPPRVGNRPSPQSQAYLSHTRVSGPAKCKPVFAKRKRMRTEWDVYGKPR